MNIKSVKGFRDILPEEAGRRRRIVEAARATLESYGFKEVELPLIERGELFHASVGTTTDIVEKEMYSFEDRDGSMIALRPEGTASLVRAYIEGGLARAMPVARLYYLGPMFRRERPQKGRFRQFTQIGAELIGRDDAACDAEMICLVADLCVNVGLQDVRIEVNSLGDAVCRPAYREALASFARRHEAELCHDCRVRLGRNPLRLLDCKKPDCRAVLEEAPRMIEQLCNACSKHHARVLALLDALGISYVSNPFMVRGLDYYCRTAFEIVAEGLGSQDAIGGGGRYDGLVADLGGPAAAGVGFAFGLERLELAGAGGNSKPGKIEFVIVPLEDPAVAAAIELARKLRRAGYRVEVGDASRRLKAQLRKADKAAVHYVVILGEEELAAGAATVRDMIEGRDHSKLFHLGDSVEAIMQTLEKAGTSGA